MTPSADIWGFDKIKNILIATVHLLNWFTLALAVISTIAAGVYYLAGFMSEANAKKAKTLLTVTYTGLIIVLLARLIIEGPAFLITGFKPEFPSPL